jgi:FtsP/CotA-like multicopper oxidase with cupredoxin domain
MNVRGNNTQPRRAFRRAPVAAAIAIVLAVQWPASLALANGGYGTSTDLNGNVINVPTYFASSPQGIHPAFDLSTHAYSTAGVTVDTGTPLRKFVDPLGGAYNGLAATAGMTDLQAGIPLAIAEHNWFNANNGTQTKDDYYEIAVVEYTERLHSDLAKPTRLRGYVQIETPALAGAAGLKDVTGMIGSEHIPGLYPNGAPILDENGNPVYFVHQPHYLGPAIVATRGTPVRMKFHNYLPYTDISGTSIGSWNGTGGELAVPVDETIPGGGPVLKADGTPQLDATGKPIKLGQNRAGIHWHGGDTPWLSDGPPNQWIAPRGDIAYTLGIDALHPNGRGKGDSTANVPDMADPGPGAYNLFFPNNLSGRLTWYHDHTLGLTRVNVYEGMAAPFLIIDPTEQAMVASLLGASLAPVPAGTLPTGMLDTFGIPLVFQDKGFVPKNMGPNALASDGVTPASQDSKWDQTHWGLEGDLFFPHVYETNQDPNSIDGTNPVGRWDWGPWFWPVFPAQFSLPTGAYGDVTTTPESFMDTAMVNGKVYPTMTVDPKTYRFRILSASNDRSLNLGLYQAVDANGVVCDGSNAAPAIAPTAVGGTAPVACTEIRMVPARQTPGFPANWPTDGRAGGVPDPATAGPDIVQIGNEGGLLPAPAVWHSQPITYDQNVRSITVFNVLEHDLLLGGAERADVLIDFSQYAGQTLLFVNDAPAPLPGFDPRIDYYTGVGDQTAAGGAYDTLPGYGPNTRTFLQIKVNASNTSGTGGPLNIAALSTALPVAYAATQPAPLIPESVYNTPFATTNVDNYAGIGTGASGHPLFTYSETVNGVSTSQSLPVINKAIQELFDPVYGRMNATLAAELPFSSATVATTIPLAYVDTPVERLDAIKDGETQIWKITHNGVDSHPVHFHLVNVQVINRVGWDGTIKPPQANEVGWKETVRMNPLEDVYVAARASRPVAPFGLPSSRRPLDPSQAIGGGLGFTNIDPTTGAAPTTQTYLVNGISTAVPTPLGVYTNQTTDFDNEYVWHCHILGHEEFDFMRPFVFHPTVIVPDAPAQVTTTASGLTWLDTTPYGGQDAHGIPTAGTNAAYPMPTNSPQNEIGFKIIQNANVTTQVLAYQVTTTVTTVDTAIDTGISSPPTVATSTSTVPANSVLVSTPSVLALVPANATAWSGVIPAAGPSLSTAVPAAVSPAIVTVTTSGNLSTSVSTVTTTDAYIIASVTDYTYGVIAYNAAGDSAQGTAATTTSATSFTSSQASTTPGATNMMLTLVNPAPAATVPAAAAAPTGLTQTLAANGSVTLSWIGVPGATSYTVTLTETNSLGVVQPPVSVVLTGTVATATTLPLATNYTTGVLNNGSGYAFAVSATTLSGGTATAQSGLTNTQTLPPVAFSAAPGTVAGSITLNWANHALNQGNVAGLLLSWTNGATTVSKTFAPVTTGATVIGLTSAASYSFTLQAVSNVVSFNSAPVSLAGPIVAP